MSKPFSSTVSTKGNGEFKMLARHLMFDTPDKALRLRHATIININRVNTFSVCRWGFLIRFRMTSDCRLSGC